MSWRQRPSTDKNTLNKRSELLGTSRHRRKFFLKFIINTLCMQPTTNKYIYIYNIYIYLYFMIFFFSFRISVGSGYLLHLRWLFFKEIIMSVNQHYSQRSAISRRENISWGKMTYLYLFSLP